MVVAGRALCFTALGLDAPNEDEGLRDVVEADAESPTGGSAETGRTERTSSSGLTQCRRAGRTGLPGTLGTGAADCGRAHGFGGLTLLSTDVLERCRHLALLVLLDVGESGGSELAADLFLVSDGARRGRREPSGSLRRRVAGLHQLGRCGPGRWAGGRGSGEGSGATGSRTAAAASPGFSVRSTSPGVRWRVRSLGRRPGRAAGRQRTWRGRSGRTPASASSVRWRTFWAGTPP